MQCLAEMWVTVSPFAGGCGSSISWFGCKVVIRLRRSSRLCPGNKKKRPPRPKQPALHHESSYGPQGRGYKSSVYHRCSPNKLCDHFTASIRRAGCGMANENGPGDVSNGKGHADRRSSLALLKNRRF